MNMWHLVQWLKDSACWIPCLLDEICNVYQFIFCRFRLYGTELLSIVHLPSNTSNVVVFCFWSAVSRQDDCAFTRAQDTRLWMTRIESHCRTKVRLIWWARRWGDGPVLRGGVQLSYTSFLDLLCFKSDVHKFHVKAESIKPNYYFSLYAKNMDELQFNLIPALLLRENSGFINLGLTFSGTAQLLEDTPCRRSWWVMGSRFDGRIWAHVDTHGLLWINIMLKKYDQVHCRNYIIGRLAVGHAASACVFDHSILGAVFLAGYCTYLNTHYILLILLFFCDGSDLESRLFPFVTKACPRRSMLFVTFFLRCLSVQHWRFGLPVYQETMWNVRASQGSAHRFWWLSCFLE
jgi:hypothetical protein